MLKRSERINIRRKIACWFKLSDSKSNRESSSSTNPTVTDRQNKSVTDGNGSRMGVSVHVDQPKCSYEASSLTSSETEIPCTEKSEKPAKTEETAKPDEPGQTSEVQDTVSATGVIPEHLFSDLPPILRGFTDLFQFKQDKDIALLSALAVFSGCFPNIRGVYNEKKVGLNIYLVIVGPAGSGKSVAQWGFRLCEEVNKKYADRGTSLFLAADSSSAAFLRILSENEGVGILFAFEIDTFSQNSTKEWGNISPLLRQAFEHESYSAIRMGQKNETNETSIKMPRISVLFTGTWNQVIPLVPSAEDGLFSRLCFFLITMNPAWRSVFPDADGSVGPMNSIDDRLKPFQSLALEIVERFTKESTFNFDLSQEQKLRLDDHFSKLSDQYANNESDIIATIRRQGLITFRMAGLLTALRQDTTPAETMICIDTDFNIALKLSEVFITNAILLNDRLFAANREIMKLKRLTESQRIFLNNLPITEFSKQQAIEIGKNVRIKAGTTEKWLQTLQPDYIRHVKHGTYQKA